MKYQESECRLQITERSLLEVEEKYRSLLAEKVSLLSEKKMLESHNHRLASIEEKHRAVSAENAGLSARIATLASENASLLAEKILLEGQNNRILSVEEAVRSHQRSVQDVSHNVTLALVLLLPVHLNSMRFAQPSPLAS